MRKKRLSIEYATRSHQAGQQLIIIKQQVQWCAGNKGISILERVPFVKVIYLACNFSLKVEQIGLYPLRQLVSTAEHPFSIRQFPPWTQSHANEGRSTFLIEEKRSLTQSLGLKLCAVSFHGYQTGIFRVNILNSLTGICYICQLNNSLLDTVFKISI